MHLNLKEIPFEEKYYDKKEKMKNDDLDYLEYETANIFMKGACDIFAYCLKNKYSNYDIYYAKCLDNGKCHYFCVSDNKYIDARGIYNSIDEGLKHLNSQKIKKNIIDNYKVDFEYEWIKTLINFSD